MLSKLSENVSSNWCCCYCSGRKHFQNNFEDPNRVDSVWSDKNRGPFRLGKEDACTIIKCLVERPNRSVGTVPSWQGYNYNPQHGWLLAYQGGACTLK